MYRAHLKCWLRCLPSGYRTLLHFTVLDLLGTSIDGDNTTSHRIGRDMFCEEQKRARLQIRLQSYYAENVDLSSQRKPLSLITTTPKFPHRPAVKSTSVESWCDFCRAVATAGGPGTTEELAAEAQMHLNSSRHIGNAETLCCHNGSKWVLQH